MINREPPPTTPPPTVETRQDDRLDWIAMRLFGYVSGAVEALLDANPGLADAPVKLPVGMVINVPRLAAPKPQRVRLWT